MVDGKKKNPDKAFRIHLMVNGAADFLPIGYKKLRGRVSNAVVTQGCKPSPTWRIAKCTKIRNCN